MEMAARPSHERLPTPPFTKGFCVYVETFSTLQNSPQYTTYPVGSLDWFEKVIHQATTRQARKRQQKDLN